MALSQDDTNHIYVLALTEGRELRRVIGNGARSDCGMKSLGFSVDLAYFGVTGHGPGPVDLAYFGDRPRKKYWRVLHNE